MSVDTAATIAQALRAASGVLFDFDGPLCDVFAGMPASGVARSLERLAGFKVDTDDPLEVLRYAATRLDAGALRRIEDALIEAEVAAIAVSEPTVGGPEAVDVFLRAGRRVGVVSNNSGTAVRAFLNRYGLDRQVSPVIGRAYAQPELMKPNPWPLERALSEMDLESTQVVFIGDSLADVQAASIAGVPCVAVANKPDKWAQFEGTSVVAIVGSMAAVLTAAASAHAGGR